MTIVFSCANCGKRFEVDGGVAGKKGKCKQCGHIFVIPTPSSWPQPEAPNQPAQKSRGVEASQASSPTRSSSASLRSSSRTPEAQPYAPAYVDDAIDRFGLDDPPPAPKPSVYSHTESYYDGDELPAPRRIKPTSSTSGKRKSARGNEGAGFFGGLPGIVYLIVFAVIGVAAVLAAFSPAGVLFLMGAAGVSFFVLGLYGAIGMIVIPFQESAACGLMCLFVPFYGLYYTITRWDAMRGAFLSGLAAYAGIIVAAVLLPAVNAGRQAAQRAVAADRQAATHRPVAAAEAPPAVPGADGPAFPGADGMPFPAPNRPAFPGRNRQPFPGRNGQAPSPGFPGLATPPPAGGPNAITVIVTGINGQQAGKDFGDKLTELVKKVTTGYQLSGTGDGARSTYQITPHQPIDVQAFADQITWAKVTRVRGRTIEVDASKTQAD
jgi:hypothetical protein